MQSIGTWQSPLDVARQLDLDCWVLLYSGLPTPDSGRYSLLAVDAEEVIEGNSFLHMQEARGNYFGWLGYGLRHRLETLPGDMPGSITLPDLWMMRPKTLLRFDHETQTVISSAARNLHLRGEDLSPVARNDGGEAVVTELSSNMTKPEYLACVRRTIEQIHKGTFYQANITRKFYGRFDRMPDAFALFERLCTISPSPYSAFIRDGERAILSSSPERFLQITAAGHIVAQPIKGSAPRGATAEEDSAILELLKYSEKDRAENLMIVDLMRNDMARCCIPGSVEVSALYDIRSYATIHQMVSTISGRKRPESSALDVVKACFPPGSMTGAPKIEAMRWCTQQEKLARGVYSGAIGWFGDDGSCDLSVVIRTLIIEGDRFEFQVGGGIVADSDPEKEWEETLVKARAIAQALGIEMGHLAGI